MAQAVGSLSIGQHIFYGVLGTKIAFWEETLFRGDLVRVLAPRMGGAAVVVVSAVVFALYHLHLDDFSEGYRAILCPGMFMKFFFGVTFALPATRMRSLLPGAIAHALIWAIICDT